MKTGNIVPSSAACARWALVLALLLAAGSARAQALIERGPWCGAVTASSVVVKAKLAREGATALLIVSRNQDLSAPRFPSAAVTSSKATNNVVTLFMNDLTPDTTYFYALQVDGRAQTQERGQFKTFPAGRASFRFVYASCATTGSNHDVFRTIARHQPLFYLNDGDLHYNDISSEDRNLYRAAYDAVLAAPAQAALYRAAPLVYVWDDHDFAGNDSNATSPGRSAARLTYQEYVPHYPLVAGQGDVAIYQAFTVGRVRFLVSDVRSERTPASAPDDANKSMLGTRQKEWLKRELLAAKDQYPLVFWVSSVSWLSKATAGVDNWGAYATERKEIADFLKANAIKNVCILSGDAHMLAADSGANADYATGGGAPVPVMQAASLDRKASFKGGPYYDAGFYGPRAGEGCFGLVEVRDKGDKVEVAFSGRNQLDQERIALAFSVPAKP